MECKVQKNFKNGGDVPGCARIRFQHSYNLKILLCTRHRVRFVPANGYEMFIFTPFLALFLGFLTHIFSSVGTLRRNFFLNLFL